MEAAEKIFLRFLLKNLGSIFRRVMEIAFFNPTSEDFHRKRINGSYLNEKIEVCDNNIHEFLSIIQIFIVFASVVWEDVKLDYSLKL